LKFAKRESGKRQDFLGKIILEKLIVFSKTILFKNDEFLLES